MPEWNLRNAALALAGVVLVVGFGVAGWRFWKFRWTTATPVYTQSLPVGRLEAGERVVVSVDGIVVEDPQTVIRVCNRQRPVVAIGIPYADPNAVTRKDPTLGRFRYQFHVAHWVQDHPFESVWEKLPVYSSPDGSLGQPKAVDDRVIVSVRFPERPVGEEARVELLEVDWINDRTVRPETVAVAAVRVKYVADCPERPR